jgi:thiol:disulfide interchange protein DsbC
MHLISKSVLTLCLCLLAWSVHAQEAVLRKNLGDRFPQLKKIDEVRPTGIAGVYELRINGSDILYTDAQGNYLIQGTLIDTKTNKDLTQERIDKLIAINVGALPLKDAFTIVRGNGKRKLIIFEDPNCGYCKQFERDLQNVDNITIHMFLYPILGPSSAEKSRAIWCSKDRGKAWMDWMVRDQQPAPANPGCDATALMRNLEIGRGYKITGTPTLVFINGSRVPGAVDAAQVEKLLNDAKG